VKELWILLAVVAGAAVGVTLHNWKTSHFWSSPSPSKSSNPSSPSQSPGNPLPSNPNDQMCAQIVTTCNDGTIVGTPCDCKDHGGPKQAGVLV